MDPHLVAALVGGGLAALSSVGLVRRRVVVRAMEARRERFVAGLPVFEKGASQRALVSALERHRRAHDALTALAEAAAHVDLAPFAEPSGDAEAHLLAYATQFVHDARSSFVLAAGRADARARLVDDPAIVGALEREGAAALRGALGAEAHRERIVAREGELAARIARLRASGLEPGSIEDRVTTMAHASALGALGAKVGAAVGTLVLPGVGTVVGTALGALAVGVGGATVARERDLRARRERSARADALEEGLAILVPASARAALANVREADARARAALAEARARAAAPVPRPRATRAKVDELLRALAWRLDEGDALLASDGRLLGSVGSAPFVAAAAAAEEARAGEALRSRKRSSARATEALKSALREPDPIAALGWVVAVALPSHPDVDALFDAVAELLARHVDDETEALERERTALVEAWEEAVRAVDGCLRAELERHAKVREDIVARAVDD